MIRARIRMTECTQNKYDVRINMMMQMTMMLMMVPYAIATTMARAMAMQSVTWLP